MPDFLFRAGPCVQNEIIAKPGSQIKTACINRGISIGMYFIPLPEAEGGGYGANTYAMINSG